MCNYCSTERNNKNIFKKRIVSKIYETVKRIPDVIKLHKMVPKIVKKTRRTDRSVWAFIR